jgi:putative Ca2+/H+ antiporter (TMEM165/GDT1 family)
MDGLMAALVVALLAQGADRFAWLVAVLADRWGAALVMAMAALALVLASGIAAAGGALIAPQLTPAADQLFVALALVFAGGGAFLPVKAPDRLAGWRVGAVLTSMVGLFILAFGDAVMFVVLTLAARTSVPWLAAAGATIGSLAAVAPAAVLGEAGWRSLPLTGVRRAGGAVLLLAGVASGLGALGLV